MKRTHWDISVSAAWDTTGEQFEDYSDVSTIREMFGLGRSGGLREVLYENFHLVISAGQIVVVIGPSGSGKTTLIQSAARFEPQAVMLEHESLSDDDRPVVACLKGGSLTEKLEVLSRCGLAEATLLIRPARNLSGGQMYRLATAIAIWRAIHSRKRRLILADEFASTLDAPTAQALAVGVRKLVSKYNLSLLISTPRQELVRFLAPDRIIVKPLNRPCFELDDTTVKPVRRHPSRRWQIKPGKIADYHELGRFHYLAGRPAALKRIWTIPVPRRHRKPGWPDIAAVLVVSPPVLNCRGRNVATDGRYAGANRRLAVARLNRELECISRVIVHPIYRGCGLAVRLVKHALTHASTPLVEALAAMGAVHPFFELAGMTYYGQFKGPSQRYCYYLARVGKTCKKLLSIPSAFQNHS